MGWFDGSGRERRQENREHRREQRAIRQANRQANRTERSGIRAETRQTAYENGIDPNAWIADGIGSAANAAASIYGGGKEASVADVKQQGNMQIALYAAGAFLLYKMMK